jgi:hypothetical protein
MEDEHDKQKRKWRWRQLEEHIGQKEKGETP